jgi:VWFA-related protein
MVKRKDFLSIILKKPILLTGILFLALTLLAQEISHKTMAINIEVPVRVFKGDTFIDNLTINDFEVYEDGILQKIEAVYLIEKTTIVREETEIRKEEAQKKFIPETSRNFVLLFELKEYLPKIGEAIDYFFEKVISPGDTLKVITPLKTYEFKDDSFEILPKQEISDNLKKKLKKDTRIANARYWSLVRDLLDHSASRREVIEQLKNFVYFDQKKLFDFADYLKTMEGQKYVFLFYQTESIPIPRGSEETLDIFEYMKDVTFDVKKVKQAFSDSSISSHFIYITKSSDLLGDVTNPGVSGMQMLDQSHGIYGAFREMAKATGGITDSSANAAAAFERVVDASENYYLLYYTPKDYKADGKFRKIKVKIKDKDYRVFHRAGYLAE